MARRPSKKQRLREYLAAHPERPLRETHWRQLREWLAPVSDSYLRECLRDVDVEPPWGGVRQHTLEELQASLVAFTAAYENGDAALRRQCRDVVIQAKDRAAAQARSARLPESTRRLKAEMRAWMLVWLENPAVFPGWAHLRTRRLQELD